MLLLERKNTLAFGVRFTDLAIILGPHFVGVYSYNMYIYICIHSTYIFIIIFGIPDSGAMNHILLCFDRGTYGELWDSNSKD